MKKILLLALLLLPLCFVGCGGDDDEDPPVGPTGPPRVIGHAASAAPSGTDLGDAVWESAATTTVTVAASSFSPEFGERQEHSTAMAVSDLVTVSAITFRTHCTFV